MSNSTIIVSYSHVFYMFLLVKLYVCVMFYLFYFNCIIINDLDKELNFFFFFYQKKW